MTSAVSLRWNEDSNIFLNDSWTYFDRIIKVSLNIMENKKRYRYSGVGVDGGDNLGGNTRVPIKEGLTAKALDDRVLRSEALMNVTVEAHEDSP